MSTGHDHGQGHGPAHVHGQDAPADVAWDAAFWDERYRSSSALWSGQPNPQLVIEAGDLRPGTALDVGCGEGADAIWLATRGWRVTAVDISTVALERGAAQAGAVGDDVGLRISWLQADLIEWNPPASYDLVSAQFMHLPKAQRQALFGRLAASVAPGGTLLIVGHHPSDLQTAMQRPHSPELFFTASEIAASLDRDGWTVIVEESRARETRDPEGTPVTVHDAILRAQRRS